MRKLFRSNHDMSSKLSKCWVFNCVEAGEGLLSQHWDCVSTGGDKRYQCVCNPDAHDLGRSGWNQ